MNDVYQQFAISLVKKALTAAGAILVAKGYAEDDVMREVAAGLALLLVSTLWSFWSAHRAALHARLLILLGLEADPSTSPAQIAAAAKRALRQESHVLPTNREL